MHKRNKKSDKYKSKEERLVHCIPNKFHLENCMYGSTATKSKKAYTRKEKHKKDYLREC